MNREGKKGNLVTKFFICQEELKGQTCTHNKMKKKKFQTSFQEEKKNQVIFLGFCKEIALMINIYKKKKYKLKKSRLRKKK